MLSLSESIVDELYVIYVKLLTWIYALNNLRFTLGTIVIMWELIEQFPLGYISWKKCYNFYGYNLMFVKEQGTIYYHAYTEMHIC